MKSIMPLRIWPFVAFAFCVLLLLVTLSAWRVLEEMRALDRRSAQVHQTYQRIDNALTDIRTDVYRESSLIRQILAHAEPASIQKMETALASSRAETDASLRTLAALLEPAQRRDLDLLRNELAADWTAQQATDLVTGKNTLRDSILQVAEQIDQLNTANVNYQEKETEASSAELQRFLKRNALLLLLLSAAIAGATTYYLSRLEREARQQKERAEQAELELRRLSNQLVSAQEEERKTISRELHDEVGQILTGLRMELGSLQSAGPGFQERLDSVKALAADALRSIRNLAMLLRPSMLDDLGLPAALRWQAKEFMRRTEINTVVRIDGPFDHLPDAYRTCLYRVIQEATTNIGRHANARNVLITLSAEPSGLTASVQDDGQGFQKKESRRGGLGLLGMQERARDLQGRVTIESEQGKGTLVKVELPLPEGTLVNAE